MNRATHVIQVLGDLGYLVLLRTREKIGPHAEPDDPVWVSAVTDDHAVHLRAEAPLLRRVLADLNARGFETEVCDDGTLEVAMFRNDAAPQPA